MKLLLLTLTLLSTQAFAESAQGTSLVYDILGGDKIVTITGNSAKLLYKSLKIRGSRLDDTNQRVGQNVTCNEMLANNNSKVYSCELRVDKKGAVGQGAHG